MSLESVSSCAARNGRSILLYGKIIPEDEVVNQIRAITLPRLCETARSMLDLSKISFCAAGKVKSKSAYAKLLGIN